MRNGTLTIDSSSLNEFIKKVDSKNIIISCPISLEKNLYENDYFNLFIKKINECKDLISKTKKVQKIQIDVGDTLNRHIWYYRYCKDYILQNNLEQESEIPEKIRRDFEKKSYLMGNKQGKEWFKNNLDSINLLIPKNFRLPKNFQLNNHITVLYRGDEKNPRIEFIRYNYWLEHPQYKKVEKALKDLCCLKNSLIDRAYNKAVKYYLDRLRTKGKTSELPDLFKQQSYNYLFDEGVAACILHREINNVIEIYFGGSETIGTQVFRGKKAQNDPIIQKYLKGPLKGADQRKFVSVKMVEE
jgi:hypothetical protein